MFTVKLLYTGSQWSIPWPIDNSYIKDFGRANKM